MANGCPTCPGGAGSLYPDLVNAGLMATDAEMVLVEYIGTDPSKRYWRGVSSRMRYPFGAYEGGTERYVLREDLGGFLRDTGRFRIHLDNTSTEHMEGISPPSEGVGSVSDTVQLQETTGS